MSNEYNGKKRSELPDSVFGIPQERKYPMPDEKHTRSAIKLFNHVDPKYEEQLAKAVIKNMKKYGIDGSVVGPNNRLRKYLPKDMIKESVIIPPICSFEREPIQEYQLIPESGILSVIRPIPKKDKDDIQHIMNNLDSFEDFVFNNICFYDIERHNQTPIGFVILRKKPELHAAFVSIGVVEEYKGSGIGSKLLEKAISYFKSTKDLMWLEYRVDVNNQASIALAEKSGFTKYLSDNTSRSLGYYKYYMRNDNNLDEPVQESAHKSDFSYSGIKTSAEKSEFKRNFREVFKEDPTESSINYMQIIKYKGDLVGYIGFSRYKEGKKKYLGIGNFMILKRYQRSGMGSKVISDIIDRYKDNYDEIYCYVDKDNTNAIAFYKKIAKVNTDNLTKYGYYVTLYSKSIGESAMLEGYLKSDKDIYYNKDKFDSGEINLCFITGLSGSGKSTMGRGMSSKDVEHYEMDDVICNDNFSDNNLKEYGGLIESFFKGSGKSFRLIRGDDNHNDSVFKSHKNYEKEITQAFVKHTISYCKSHKGIKYVCDGIWIFMFIKPEQLKDCAVYIKGTSSIKSGYRALRRDIDEDKRNGMSSLQIFKHEFKRIKEDVLYARENQKELKYFRSYFEKQLTNESYIEEGFLKSDKDIYYNKDKFDSGEINLCFITGLIGSGKTTMSKEISSKNIECYEIDDVIFNYCLSDDNLKDKKLLYLFFNGIGKKYRYRYKDNEYNHNLYYSFENYEKDITIDFVKYSIEYASSYTNKIVIDGIWIYLYIEPKLLSDYAVYIKGTSMVKSSYRATNRGIQNKIDKGTDLTPADIAKKYIFRIKKDLKFGKMHMQKLKSFRSYFEKQLTNESYLLQEASSNKVYHLSQTNLNGKTIQPTVPSSYMTVNGYEDSKTKRVCFATSIDGCLRGLSIKCEGMKLFVHVPDGNYNIYKPSNKEVPYASITGEVWIKKAVKMKCIGQIYVIRDKGEDGIPYKYGDKTAELYDWEWKWINKFHEASILPLNTGITTVIFDLGDVLVSANIKDYLVADPEVPNEIVDELLRLWFIDKDEVDDTMDLDTYREIVNKRMGVEFSKYIPKLFQYNVDCVTAFDYTIPMIQDLKNKGYKVYYLSNWSAWTHDLLQEAGKFDFLKLMDGGVFSYDAGYMKPDEEIYKILLNKYKINPQKAVFFDDREENIEAANKLGIRGVHFPRHDSSIVYNYFEMLQITYEIFDISYNFKTYDMPEFITFSPKPALETVCMDIEFIPDASVTQDDAGSVKVKSYNKRYYDYDTVMQSFIEAAKREDFPISIQNGNDRFEYTPSTKEKPYGEVGGVSISKGGFTEETIQEELAKHSIAIENQHMVAKSSMKIIKPVILNNDGYRKRAKNLNLKLRCDLLPVKGPTINIRVLDRYQNCEDPSSAKQLLDDIKESCVTVANKLSGTFQYYVEEVTTDDNGCLNLHIKKMKVVSYNSDNEVVKEEDMEYPDFPIVLDIDSDITTVDIDKTLEESAVQEYGTTGGTIVGSNQPDSVYIVNYMQNNVFSGYKEPKRAICKKGMNQMYTTKNGKAIPVDIDNFKEEASDISVFRFKGTPVLSYDQIIENASTDNDFYLLLTGDSPEAYGDLEYDNRFIQEENFFDELRDITFCTESTITGQIESSNYPYMKILTESMDGRSWNFYRDINGVFAMNELTGLRTPSYENTEDIPISQIRLIERGTVYFGN